MVIIDGKRWVDIKQFMKENNIKTRKTVYDWVNSGRVEKKQLLSSVVFCLK